MQAFSLEYGGYDSVGVELPVVAISVYCLVVMVSMGIAAYSFWMFKSQPSNSKLVLEYISLCNDVEDLKKKNKALEMALKSKEVQMEEALLENSRLVAQFQKEQKKWIEEIEQERRYWKSAQKNVGMVGRLFVPSASQQLRLSV
eukprot:Nk52_evm23s229 gene=Nk52_evmTU23s229